MGREKRQSSQIQNQTEVQSEDLQNEYKEEQKIPYNTWVAGWEALKRNGFSEFVKWTQLGREEEVDSRDYDLDSWQPPAWLMAGLMDKGKGNELEHDSREPKAESSNNDSWYPTWSKKESVGNKKEGKEEMKDEKTEHNSRDSKSVSPGNDSWNPPLLKASSKDHKMGMKVDEKSGVKVGQEKQNVIKAKDVSTDLKSEQPSFGTRNSINQKRGSEMKMSYDREVLDPLEELDTIEELEEALQDFYDSISNKDEYEGEMVKLEESQKQPSPQPSPTMMKLILKEEQKSLGRDNYQDKNSWQPPWGKSDSMDLKMNMKDRKEKELEKGNPRVSDDTGKTDSMDQETEVQMDQKIGVKMERGTLDPIKSKTIILDRDSWQTLMKGLKIKHGTADSKEPQKMSLDLDLWQTLMHEGKLLEA